MACWLPGRENGAGLPSPRGWPCCLPRSLSLSSSFLSFCASPFPFSPPFFRLHWFFLFMLLILFCPWLFSHCLWGVFSLLFSLPPSLSMPKWVSTSLSPTSSPSFGFLPPPVQGAMIKTAHVTGLMPAVQQGAASLPQRLVEGSQLLPSYWGEGTGLE